MKKIAIIVLDQRSNRSRLEHLKSDEYYYVLFAPEVSINGIDADSKKLFSEIVVVDKDINSIELAELVRPYLDRVSNENLYLITSREFFMTRVAEVQQILSLSGIGLGDLAPFKDKLVMKDIVSSSHIRTPWHIPFNKNEYLQKGQDYLKEINHIVENTVGYPIFVKPIAQEGAIDSKKIDDYDELVQWSHSARLDLYQYELDEYIAGDLYHCDSVIKNNEVLYCSLSLCSYPMSYFAAGKPMGSLDLLPENLLWKALEAFNQKVITALRPPDGVTHHEIFRKVDGELVFLEIAARPPGGYICQVHEINTGINFETEHFRLQLKLPTQLTADYRNAFCCWLYLPKRAGKIIKLNEPDIKSRYEISWYVSVGDTVTASENVASASQLAGLIFMYNENHAQLLHDFHIMKDFVAMEVS